VLTVFTMQKLQDIPVYTESPQTTSPDHGNAVPLLHEILHALEHLRDSGKPTTIDLRAIASGPGDEARLFEVLGRGEVSAQLDALGMSEIRESRFAGVWLVEHKNSLGERIALQVEITHVPGILLAQQEDIAEAASRLEDQLGSVI
jgi:hydrogenase-1 operon protein HyaF